MPPDLPPRISNQQMFILAWSRDLMTRREIREIGHPIPVVDVSFEAAKEFDQNGSRKGKIPTPDELKERIAEGIDEGNELKVYLNQKTLDEGRHLHDRPPKPHLTAVHSSSFSRSLNRLEDRGLVDSYLGRGRHEPKRTGIRLTDEGREVADEILRRHRDGRYTLSFDTLD